MILRNLTSNGVPGYINWSVWNPSMDKRDREFRVEWSLVINIPLGRKSRRFRYGHNLRTWSVSDAVTTSGRQTKVKCFWQIQPSWQETTENWRASLPGRVRTGERRDCEVSVTRRKPGSSHIHWRDVSEISCREQRPVRVSLFVFTPPPLLGTYQRGAGPSETSGQSITSRWPPSMVQRDLKRKGLTSRVQEHVRRFGRYQRSGWKGRRLYTLFILCWWCISWKYV